MITRKLAFVFLGLLDPMQAASAGECLLSHATYREPRSGAVMQFRPLDNEPAAATTEVFSLTVPHTDIRLPADITWTNGKNSFPLGTIRHPCTDEDREAGLQDGSGLCRIWDGQVYALTGGRAVEFPRSDTGAERAVAARFRRHFHRMARFRQGQSRWFGVGCLHLDRMQR